MSVCKLLHACICIYLNAVGKLGAMFLFNDAQLPPLSVHMGSGERGTAGRAQRVLLSSRYRWFITWVKPGKRFPRIWSKGAACRAGCPVRCGVRQGGRRLRCSWSPGFRVRSILCSFKCVFRNELIFLPLWKIAN